MGACNSKQMQTEVKLKANKSTHKATKIVFIGFFVIDAVSPLTDAIFHCLIHHKTDQTLAQHYYLLTV